MPFTDISADQITGGAFTDTYTIRGLFIVGDTAGAHVVIGADTHGADGVRLYGPDGVTPVIDLNIGGGAVAGSTVVGPVANATNAANAANAANATNAGTATNLGGGGTAAGDTAITGSLTVGNPAAAHVVIGTDVHGADGVRLYAANGTTPLIDITIAGTPTITGAIVQTAATGARVLLDGSGVTGPRDSILFFNGANDPTASLTRIYGSVGADFGGNSAPALSIEAGALAAPTGFNVAGITLTAAAVDKKAAIEYGTSGVQRAGANHIIYGPVRVRAGSNVAGASLTVDGTATFANAIQSSGVLANDGGGNLFVDIPGSFGAMGDRSIVIVTVHDGFSNNLRITPVKWSPGVRIYCGTVGAPAKTEDGSITVGVGTTVLYKVFNIF